MHAELPPMDLSVFNNGTTSQNSKAQVKIAAYYFFVKSDFLRIKSFKFQEHMHKFAQQLQNDHEESDRKQNLKGKQILNKKGNFILTKNKFSVEITYEIIQLSDNGFQTWKALKKYIFTYFYT